VEPAPVRPAVVGPVRADGVEEVVATVLVVFGLDASVDEPVRRIRVCRDLRQLTRDELLERFGEGAVPGPMQLDGEHEACAGA